MKPASLLDTDLYKFTMQQAVFHRFADATAGYRFDCRTPGIDFSPIVGQLRAAIAGFSEIRLDDSERAYLESLGLFKPDYLDFLSRFRFDPRFVSVSAKPVFALTIEGPWLQTILFEVPLLATINELYFQNQPNLEAEGRLEAKIASLKNDPAAKLFRFADFGTRRRFSRSWHETLLARLKAALPGQFLGTSNVHFSKELGLRPSGTMAHEYLQAAQVLCPDLRNFQKFALSQWLDEYEGKLAIALSDVLTFDAFLVDFDADLARRYDGVRQDSGDPLAWGEKMLAHYAKLGIDAKQKSLVFSDGLSFEKAVALNTAFSARAKPLFGIGTHLTNDTGAEPIQIVIKMTHCNGQPVVKISDSPDKLICADPRALQKLKKTFGLK